MIRGSRTSSASPAPTCGGCASRSPACTTRTSTAGWPVMTASSCSAACAATAAGGAARAFLSDGYKIIDNLDVLLAALDGVRGSGYPVQVDGCDLTERRMYVRVVCEQVRVLAPALLAGYRSPFTGAAGADNPVVFSGFVITNCETGCGAFTPDPAAGRAGLPQRDDHHPRRDARRAPGRAARRRRGHLVGQHPGQDPGPDHRQDHRRGRHVPGPGLRAAGGAGDGTRRRAPGRRPAGDDPHGVSSGCGSPTTSSTTSWPTSSAAATSPPAGSCTP